MSDNSIDFKNIWQQQKVSQPNLEELLNKLKQFKHASLKKLFISNIFLLVVSGLILFIWYFYQPKFLTTKIGIVLTILAMIIYLFAYNKLYPFYTKINTAQTSNEYLESLIQLKNKQKFMQTKMLRLYFIMLSVGICLYMIEYASKMDVIWAIVTYATTLTWIGFNWFYIRPKMIKKQEAKLTDLIAKFDSVNRDLNRY